jgi:hypothetical protein
MNMVLKRVLIVAGLIVFCGAVFAGVKSYGVWVIHRGGRRPVHCGAPQEG